MLPRDGSPAKWVQQTVPGGVGCRTRKRRSSTGCGPRRRSAGRRYDYYCEAATGECSSGRRRARAAGRRCCKNLMVSSGSENGFGFAFSEPKAMVFQRAPPTGRASNYGFGGFRRIAPKEQATSTFALHSAWAAQLWPFPHMCAFGPRPKLFRWVDTGETVG